MEPCNAVTSARMSTHIPSTPAIGAGILATNAASWWASVNWSQFWATTLTVVSVFWVVVQTLKFCLRWLDEHRAKRADADKVCEVRREIGACPLGRSSCPPDGDRCER